MNRTRVFAEPKSMTIDRMLMGGGAIPKILSLL